MNVPAPPTSWPVNECLGLAVHPGDAQGAGAITSVVFCRGTRFAPKEQSSSENVKECFFRV